MGDNIKPETLVIRWREIYNMTNRKPKMSYRSRLLQRQHRKKKKKKRASQTERDETGNIKPETFKNQGNLFISRMGEKNRNGRKKKNIYTSYIFCYCYRRQKGKITEQI